MSHTYSPSWRSSSNTVGDEDEAIAALLHDAVEDQGGPLAYIAGISGKSASVRLVSAADKLHNARCILGD